MTGAKTKVNIKIFDTEQILAKKFTDELIAKINAKTKGHKSLPYYLAISGGNTPKILFEELSSRELDAPFWESVYIFWVDERCVPPDNPDSNYGMAHEYLIKNISIPQSNIFRMRGEDDPNEAKERYTKDLLTTVPLSASKLPQFDQVILGLGDDGHTASIFPNQIHLFNSPNLCETTLHPITKQVRITLTGKIINNAKDIVFLVTGKSKKQKVYSILNKTDNFRGYPASLVEPVHGNLTWYLDKQAAEGLKL